MTVLGKAAKIKHISPMKSRDQNDASISQGKPKTAVIAGKPSEVQRDTWNVFPHSPQKELTL